MDNHFMFHGNACYASFSSGEILDYIKQNLPGSVEVLVEDTEGIGWPTEINSLCGLCNNDVVTFLLAGLAYFTDLVEELDRAISGAKYGDYIMSGLLIYRTRVIRRMCLYPHRKRMCAYMRAAPNNKQR